MTPQKQQNINKFAEYINMINSNMKANEKHINDSLKKYYDDNTKIYRAATTGHCISERN